MVFEEYCNYILTRERDREVFTVPGSTIEISKSDLLANMRLALRDYGYKDYDYDSLLVHTLRCYVSNDSLGKNKKLDEKMDTVLNNIRTRTERIYSLYMRMDRRVPFSYERVFEILVYYLRLKTNILKSEKEQTVHYVTAEISPETVFNAMNRKLTMECLDEEWEKKGWKAFNLDISLAYLDKVNNYFKFLLLSTYIRYCEIKGL